MEEIKLSNNLYKLTKVYADGSYEHKITGMLQLPDCIVKLNQRCIVGRGMNDYWSTSCVTEIEKIHNGIKFETENSTYILEEVE